MKAFTKNILKKLFRVYLKVAGNWEKLLVLESSSTSFRDFVFNDSRIFWKSKNLTFKRNQVSLLKGFEYIVALEDAKIGKFSNENDSIVFTAPNFQVKVENWEELYILNELFLNGDYNLFINMPFILFDIGMNVGFTSLVFANKSNCKAIYSYEPFKATFECALDNIKRNRVGHKITPHNFGIFDEDKVVDVEYVPEARGSIGVSLPDWIKKQNRKDIEKVKIELRNTTVLRELLEQNLDSKIVFKIDCEGSEYQILESMERNGILRKVDVFMIEWHYRGPERIIDILTRNGFASISLKPLSPNIGMIYSVRA